jgi:non-heme chloroperoxidase
MSTGYEKSEIRITARDARTFRRPRGRHAGANTPLVVKTADNPDGVDRRLLEDARARLSKDCPHVIAAAARWFFNTLRNSVSAEMMQWWTDMVLKCSLRVLLDLHRMFTETDFRSELRQISLPTVIIHGDSDTSAPIDRTGRKTASLIQSV